MQFLVFFAPFMAAIPWAAASLVGKVSGVPAPVMPIVIAIGSLIACIPTMFLIQNGQLEWNTAKWGFLAGMLNGIGMAIGWGVLVAGSARGWWKLSSVMPITYTLLFVFIAIGASLFTGENVTPRQWAGMLIAGFAIYLLR